MPCPYQKTKKIMKKLLYLTAIIGMMTAVFASCDKDFKNSGTDLRGAGFTIRANVENGNLYNRVFHEIQANMYGCGRFTLATSPYTNGSFTLRLLNTVDDECLYTFFAYPPSWITISDENVLANDFDIEARDENNWWLGDFIHGKLDMNGDFETWVSGTETVAVYIYADRPVTIQGSFSYTDSWYDYWDDMYVIENFSIEYNLSLRQGWNIVYETESFDARLNGNVATYDLDVLVSSTPISGLRWYYDEDWGSDFNKHQTPLARIMQKNREKNKKSAPSKTKTQSNFFDKYSRVDKK
jgi:hypothetical protein